jgi:hypothetical protein
MNAAPGFAATLERVAAVFATRRRAHEACRRVLQFFDDLRQARSLPSLTIDLMIERTADNDPFFGRIVREFHDDAQRRHPKLPLVRSLEWGVSVCVLPPTFDAYFMAIEGSARRNFRKAERSGCRFARIDMNDHLDAIGEIRRSTDTRQGRMPEEFLQAAISRCTDPPTRTDVHDYPYFGVYLHDRLVAYACCLVAGEACVVEHVYGHAAHLADGIVPMLFIGIAEHVYRSHPQVRYYVYGTHFGALPKLRRFKKKFCFFPHRVDWQLDARR